MDSDGDPRSGLPPDLNLLFEAFRREMDAKIQSLKYFGIAMTVGGGTLGGIVASLKPHETVGALASILHLVA